MRKNVTALFLGVIMGFTPAQSAVAEQPTPFQDFTFKRVKVPSKNSGPRINVQIKEQEEASAKPSEENTTPLEPTNSAYGWFWEEISPSLSASGPGRLDKALRHLQNGKSVPVARLDTMRSIVEQYNKEILLATIGTKVSPALVLSVISVESSGAAGAVSSAGATGLMQLMPDTAARFGVTDSTNPAENIKGGVAYLDWLMGEFESDPVLVLAAYNSGEGSVRRYEGVPPFAETRGYVPKVLASWAVARNLCKTQPELISDGCAFNLQGS